MTDISGACGSLGITLLRDFWKGLRAAGGKDGRAMELYLGGMAQGKLELVCRRHPQALVLDEKKLEEVLRMEKASAEAPEINGWVIWDHFHLFVKSMLAKGAEPVAIWELVTKGIEETPNLCIISDEIGNGIVPMEKEERIYREETGRILCKIAGKAESVERVVCGISVKIK